MARTLDDIYNFYRYIVRKERGVFVTLTEFTRNLDSGQMDCFQEYFDLYGKTQTIHDAIKPFRIYYQFTSDSAGFVTLPSDCIHILGQPFTVAGSTVNRIEFCNEDELPFALTSQLRPVSNSYPIAVDTANGFSIYPQSTQVGFFNYLRRPNTPVYATVQDGRFVAFDATNSIELEWNDVYVNNIVAKALRYAGVNMNEQGVYQFAEQYNQETQVK